MQFLSISAKRYPVCWCIETLRGLLFIHVLKLFLVGSQHLLEVLKASDQIFPKWKMMYFLLLVLSICDPFFSNWFFFHNGVEVAISKLVRVLWYFIRRADVVLTAFRVVAFVSEQEINLNLWIVDRIWVDDLAKVVPLSHYLFVLWDIGSYGFLEEGAKSFD